MVIAELPLATTAQIIVCFEIRQFLFFFSSQKTSIEKNSECVKYCKGTLRNSLSDNRAASTRSFLAVLVVPHRQLLGQCRAQLKNLVKNGMKATQKQ